jgi:hypothetical protein
MSDARLVMKLSQIGFTVDQLEVMDRHALLQAWAEAVVAGKDQPVTVVATGAPSLHGYDAELERQRFEWEKAKWEDERQLQREQLRLQEASQLEKREFHAQQLKLQAEMLKRQDSERDEKQSTVSQVKRWGDAMRNSAIRMGNDTIDLVSFFEHTERLFKDLDVPERLKMQLLRPYLNDMARTLITRLDTTNAADYSFVNKYLLHQFDLSPRVFIERFNTTVRQSDETMTLFAARLKSLLKYYLDSRHINRDYEKLF